MRPSTFADALSQRLRAAPGTPLVVHYDHAAGSRVELSTTTFANWVAKTSSLVVDALGLERGERLHLDLPVHWLEVVWVGTSLNVGLVLTDDPGSADLVVVGPDALGGEGLSGSYGSAQVVASSLHPFALRFETPVPPGVVDFGAEVFGQPDAFLPYDPPTADDPAVRTGGEEQSIAELISRAASVGRGTRTLTDLPCRIRPELLLAPLLGDGMTVWSTGSDDRQWADVKAAERITAEVRREA